MSSHTKLAAKILDLLESSLPLLGLPLLKLDTTILSTSSTSIPCPSPQTPSFSPTSFQKWGKFTVVLLLA
jgi:hypothetical protein